MEHEALYGRCADLYDRIYSSKPYEEESQRIRAILAGEGIEDGSRVLEAACGTGAYLTHLCRWYEVLGFDNSPEMLEIARGKVPDARLYLADLAAFETPGPVDALLCLFSSFGYVHTDDALRSSAEAFARAVRPGGVVLIEPWLDETTFEPGFPDMQTSIGEDLRLCRASISKQEGKLSVFDFHWLVVRSGAADVEHIVERHSLRMRSTDELLGAFVDAGFDVRWDTEGLCQGRRGLVVGRRRK